MNDEMVAGSVEELIATSGELYARGMKQLATADQHSGRYGNVSALASEYAQATATLAASSAASNRAALLLVTRFGGHTSGEARR